MDFAAWIQSWLSVLTRPGEPAFEEERLKPHAGLATAAIWIGLAAIVSGIFALIQGAMFARQLNSMGGLQGIASQLGLPPEVMAQIPAGVPMLGTPAAGVGGMVWAVIAAVVGYLLFVGLLQLVAKLLGGTGNFQTYAYLIATFHAPISMATSLLSVIPVLGGCLSFIVLIYELVLAYYATRVEHKLPQGKSIVVVLAPVIIVALIGCCALFAAGSMIAAIMGSGR